MKPQNAPAPTYAFGYRRPPRSGNAINGLGVADRVRARHVFHSATGGGLDWQGLDDFFSAINPWRVVRHVIANAWQLRHQDGPVARTRAEAGDPETLAGQVKTEARRLGADLVGIVRVEDDDIFDGRTAPHPHAICIGLSMDREEMRHAPQPRAAVEVMRTYRAISRIVIELAEIIRAMGWSARAYGNPNSTDILHIPLAVRAGLGQLGKHGSMISFEHGSNIRLATVLTDLPLAFDQPTDIGVDDLCQVCQRCVIDCPPDAIFNEPQMVRGVRKWYVDFDRCIPYFVKTYGCAICIEVCPWSEPGRGPALRQRLLDHRTRRQSDTAHR